VQVSWPQCPNFQRRNPLTSLPAYLVKLAQSPRTASIKGGTPSHACSTTWRRATSVSTTRLALCPRLTCMAFFSPCTTPRCSTVLTAGLVLPLFGASSMAWCTSRTPSNSPCRRTKCVTRCSSAATKRRRFPPQKAPSRCPQRHRCPPPRRPCTAPRGSSNSVRLCCAARQTTGTCKLYICAYTYIYIYIYMYIYSLGFTLQNYNRVMEHTRFLLLTRSTSLIQISRGPKEE